MIIIIIIIIITIIISSRKSGQPMHCTLFWSIIGYFSNVKDRWPGSSSGKALGPGSILGDEGGEIFLRSFLSRLVLGSTQPSIK